MNYANSSEFFDISVGPQPDNTLQARWVCIKDFLKRCAAFPFALFRKACKTFFRALGLAISIFLVLVTLGVSVAAREMFLERIASFAKDLADWILLPLAIVVCFLRLILALFIHPTIYSSAL